MDYPIKPELVSWLLVIASPDCSQRASVETEVRGSPMFAPASLWHAISSGRDAWVQAPDAGGLTYLPFPFQLPTVPMTPAYSCFRPLYNAWSAWKVTPRFLHNPFPHILRVSA